MNKEFLNKVCDQILSETRINNDRVYTPFISFHFPSHYSSFFLSLSLHVCSHFSSHCKEVYSLNEEEIEYVWTKYKEVIPIINDKELIH
jgi:hypothetical protein